VHDYVVIKFESAITYLGFPEVYISMAEGSEEDLQTNLHGLRWSHLHFLDHQWLSSFPCHSSYNTSIQLIINKEKEKLKFMDKLRLN
jgi:hypothetical protein